MGRFISSIEFLIVLFLLLFLRSVVQGRAPHPPHILTGAHAVRGSRATMEDTHLIVNSDDIKLAAVFDGHGGPHVSDYLKKQIMKRILYQQSIEPQPLEGQTEERLLDVLIRGLKSIEEDLSDDPLAVKQGSTAAILAVNVGCTASCSPLLSLIALNVGDSRIVLSRGEKALDLTRDHKPQLPEERARIEAAGGTVVWTGLTDDLTDAPLPGTGIFRLNNILALSRAMGDTSEKPAVSSTPDSVICNCTIDDEFVIVASDGLWDKFSSQDAVSFLHQMRQGSWKEDVEWSSSARQDAMEAFLDQAARALVHSALMRGSNDNISVVLVCLGDRYFRTKQPN